MPLEERGWAFVAAALCMWDCPAKAEILGSIIHAASCELLALERLREVFSSLALQAVSASLPDDEVGRRADLVATQLVGPAMTCYVRAVDRIADVPGERVVRLIGPIVQHHLTGTLGGGVSKGR